MADTTLYPTADAYVAEDAPSTNYGGSVLLYAMTRDTNRNRRSFLKFDLSGLPVGAVISLAKLRVYCNLVQNPSTPDTNVQARRVADDSWIEAEITWSNQKAYGVVEDTQTPAVGWVEWTVTDFIVAEFAGDQTVSICCRCVTESVDATAMYSRYWSKEYNGDDPELYIEYTVPITVTITDSMGMSDSVTKQFDAKKTVTDKLGLLDTAPTRGTFFQVVSDKIGLTDSVARQKSMFQTVSDILGLLDTTSTVAAFHLAVTDVLGMLDSAVRIFPLTVTISDILGIRDRLVTRKRRWPLGDLPDDTIRGGA